MEQQEWVHMTLTINARSNIWNCVHYEGFTCTVRKVFRTSCWALGEEQATRAIRAL